MARARRYFVVGATGGIGTALVHSLAAEGHQIVGTGTKEESCRALTEAAGVKTFVLDASEPDQVEQRFKEAKDELGGGIDGVVNLAGSVLVKPAHRTSLEEFYSVLKVNLVTSFLIVKYGAEYLKENGGSLVLASTAAARIGLPNHEAIAAAKSGVEGLVRSAAATYASKKIRVNAVAPGLVETGLTKGITENEATRKYSLGLHPLQRLGKPEDIASTIAWLLSPDQSWLTSQVIAVDGGLGSLKG